jgi:hypothetical protein
VILEGLALEFIDGVHLNETATIVKEKFDIEDPIEIIIGKRQRDTYNLGDDIPPQSARNIWIVTRARSGSSFLGDLLSRYPGTFYFYEPLNYLENSTENYLDVFKCRPKKGYFDHAKKYSLNRNFRVWNVCQKLLSKDEACFMPQLYYSTCPRFPIRLVKSIRVPFEEVKNVLLNPEIGKSFKIIFLFRDPRGRIQSYFHKVQNKKWPKPNICPSAFDTQANCTAAKQCKRMQTDVIAAIKLKEQYPGKYWFDIFSESINTTI